MTPNSGLHGLGLAGRLAQAFLNSKLTPLIIVASLLPAVVHAESIDRVVLPSGLTVVIAEQHTTQVVEIRVAVRAGPVHEGERLGSGLSLLTQRLIAMKMCSFAAMPAGSPCCQHA